MNAGRGFLPPMRAESPSDTRTIHPSCGLDGDLGNVGPGFVSDLEAHSCVKAG